MRNKKVEIAVCAARMILEDRRLRPFDCRVGFILSPLRHNRVWFSGSYRISAVGTADLRGAKAANENIYIDYIKYTKSETGIPYR